MGNDSGELPYSKLDEVCQGDDKILYLVDTAGPGFCYVDMDALHTCEERKVLVAAEPSEALSNALWTVLGLKRSRSKIPARYYPFGNRGAHFRRCWIIPFPMYGPMWVFLEDFKTPHQPAWHRDTMAG